MRSHNYLAMLTGLALITANPASAAQNPQTHHFDHHMGGQHLGGNHFSGSHMNQPSHMEHSGQMQNQYSHAGNYEHHTMYGQGQYSNNSNNNNYNNYGQNYSSQLHTPTYPNGYNNEIAQQHYGTSSNMRYGQNVTSYNPPDRITNVSNPAVGNYGNTRYVTNGNVYYNYTSDGVTGFAEPMNTQSHTYHQTANTNYNTTNNNQYNHTNNNQQVDRTTEALLNNQSGGVVGGPYITNPGGEVYYAASSHPFIQDNSNQFIHESNYPSYY